MISYSVFDNYDVEEVIEEKYLLLSSDNKTGVKDASGNIIIEPEYRSIGIDIDKYAQNGGENKYVLLNNIIPIQNELIINIH